MDVLHPATTTGAPFPPPGQLPSCGALTGSRSFSRRSGPASSALPGSAAGERVQPPHKATPGPVLAPRGKSEGCGALQTQSVRARACVEGGLLLIGQGDALPRSCPTAWGLANGWLTDRPLLGQPPHSGAPPPPHPVHLPASWALWSPAQPTRLCQNHLLLHPTAPTLSCPPLSPPHLLQPAHRDSSSPCGLTHGRQVSRQDQLLRSSISRSCDIPLSSLKAHFPPSPHA